MQEKSTTASRLELQQQAAEQLVNVVVDAIRDKKGTDITILDLRGLQNPLADYFVICSGTNTTQTQAICDHIWEQARVKLGERTSHIEGEREGHWVLMDYGTVVVHIFLPAARQFYHLEDLWGDAPSQFFAE